MGKQSVSHSFVLNKENYVLEQHESNTFNNTQTMNYTLKKDTAFNDIRWALLFLASSLKNRMNQMTYFVNLIKERTITCKYNCIRKLAKKNAELLSGTTKYKKPLRSLK